MQVRRQVGPGLHHAGAVRAEPEHPVRLHVEVARPVAGVGGLALRAALDIEPDRRQVLLEHPGIHGEDERLLLLRQRRGELREGGVGPPGAVAQEQPQVAAPRLDRADDVGGAVYGAIRADRGARRGRKDQRRKQHRERHD